jgi:hypothetical protein
MYRSQNNKKKGGADDFELVDGDLAESTVEDEGEDEDADEEQGWEDHAKLYYGIIYVKYNEGHTEENRDTLEEHHYAAGGDEERAIVYITGPMQYWWVMG